MVAGGHDIKRAVLPLYFIHQCPKLVNILKIAIHAGKADVGYLVELFQLAHHQLAQAGGGNFFQAQAQQLFFDPFYCGVDLLGTDGALSERQIHRAVDFVALVFNAPTVFFDDGGERDVRPLVGGEALFTGCALAAPSNEVSFF